MTDQPPTTPQATKYTITAAHRVTGKSRTTIQKHLKEGRLSASVGPDGAKLIDASELIRVYGEECDFRREEGAARSGPSGDSSALRAEAESLRDKLQTLEEERRRERDQLRAQVEHLQETLRLAQEGGNRALLLLENRSGGGEWREAFAKLRRQIEQREAQAAARAKAEAWAELRRLPWWKLLLARPDRSG